MVVPPFVIFCLYECNTGFDHGSRTSIPLLATEAVATSGSRVVLCGTPLKHQYLDALQETKSEDTGFVFKCKLACGSWRDVAAQEFQLGRDLVKMKTLNIDPNEKQTLEEQKATVQMLWKLSHASAAVTCWAWATESYTSPNCFIRILADKWSDAESGMEWVRTTFEACVQAQRHVDEQQLGDSKVALCLADIGHHEEQSVLLFWLAAFSSGCY